MSSGHCGRLHCVGPRGAGREVDVDDNGPAETQPARRPLFRRRVVRIPAGADLAFVEDDWRDAIVVVESGEVELECRWGGRRRFGPGAVLWFDGLGLRVVRNPGPVDLVIVAVSRRATSRSASAAAPDPGG